MSNSQYIFRNYRPADFDSYVKLSVESERLVPVGRYTTLQRLREGLRRPNYSPERDMFVVETGGRIVGFLNITPEQGIGRVILDCLVHPVHRRRHLATKLLGYAMRHARELKAKVAHVNISQDNLIAQSVLSQLGFRFVRQFLELRLELAHFHLQDDTHDGYLCRHMQHGEEGLLAQLQNRCFAPTWGYNPNTAEDIAFYLKSSGGSPEDIILIGDVEKPIGYCWTRIEETEAAGERKGRIHMLGIDPDFQGSRAGRTVLLAGLRHLKTKGVKVVELTVDSENTPARALYESIGFKNWTSSLWYEKAID